MANNEEMTEEKIEKERNKEGAGLTGKDILKGSLEELESREETRRIEDEAYKEKEKRERAGRAKQEEWEYHERMLRKAQGNGASTYMLIKSAEGFKEMHKKGKEVTANAIEKARDESLEYIKERFDCDEDSYDFDKDLRNIWCGTRGGQCLWIGSFNVRIKGRLTRESYLKELQETQKYVDKKWKEKAEKVKKDEVLVIREKTDKEAIREHLRGFGTAALEYGDIETAVDAFIEGNLIEDPEIAKKVAEKMKEIIESEDPEVRAKALKAKESLEKYFEEEKRRGWK